LVHDVHDGSFGASLCSPFLDNPSWTHSLGPVAGGHAIQDAGVHQDFIWLLSQVQSPVPGAQGSGCALTKNLSQGAVEARRLGTNGHKEAVFEAMMPKG